MRRIRNYVIDVINEAGAPYGIKVPKDGRLRSLVRDDQIWSIIEMLQGDLKTAKEALEKDGKEWLPVRHGKWERWTGFSCFTGRLYRCTECKAVFVLDQKKYNYCPTCGAKMDGKEEDNE